MQSADPELAQLLSRFIPVRITSLKRVDLNRFRFDYDLTFAVLMMRPNGYTYSRFGSQDWRKSIARMSIPGLKRAMRAVLRRHAAGEGEAFVEQGRPYTLADIPAYARSKAADEPCAHCHYANNFRFEQLQAMGRFAKAMVYQYPLADNIGVKLDVDRNSVVKAVAPASPAARAGVRPGDVITAADAVPVLTEADLQYALNPLPDPGRVTLQLVRDGRPMRPAVLRLPRGWRRTDVSWRPSVGVVQPSIGIWGEPLTAKQKREQGLPDDRLALRVSFLFPGDAWVPTRGDLRMGDVITGVNGRSLPEMNAQQFLAYFKMHFNVGDEATLTVLRGGQPHTFRVPCLAVKDV